MLWLRIELVFPGGLFGQLFLGDLDVAADAEVLEAA